MLRSYLSAMRIFACLASSIDGKIGPADTPGFTAITSRQDLAHLQRIRDKADGILFGAGTFRAWPKIHYGQDQTRIAHHFILSRSLALDWQAPLFQEPRVRTIIFTSSPDSRPAGLPEQVEIVGVPETEDQIQTIMTHIENLGIQALLVEGGGQILQQFMEARVLQELYLTLAPLILGDEAAPALLGNRRLSSPPRLSILQQSLLDDEAYLHLALDYNQTTL